MALPPWLLQAPCVHSHCWSPPMATQVEALKWVKGMPKFMVDAFNFVNPDCTHYFLTHFHGDHTTGGVHPQVLSLALGQLSAHVLTPGPSVGSGASVQRAG